MDYEDLLEGLLHDRSGYWPRELPLAFLRAITNDLSEDRKISEGWFATVYEGILRNGTVVAVKRLSQKAKDSITFDNEVASVMRVKHKNIVRCLGYCAEKQGKMMQFVGKLVRARERESLLCFEYLTGGSLDRYITDAPRRDWRMLYEIIKGVCEGLNHLHQSRIVHLYLKPSNILLDNQMVPKISDFDLSMQFRENQNEEILERVIGHREYMAPEWINQGRVTFKADIYSFGVVITEILTGRREQYDVHKVVNEWSDRMGTSLEDIRLGQVRVCAELGQSCTNSDPDNRPDTSHILKRLVKTENMYEFPGPDDTESMDEFTKPVDAVLKNWSDRLGTSSEDIRLGQTVELNVLERIIAGTEEPSHIDFSLLEEITGNFSETKRIGNGGCGDVYKGTLQNGVVAVKRLFKSRTIKDKMFHREVTSLITVRHENIVRFLGYCSVTEERAVTYQGRTILMDIRERLLCFEYISNGSLENHLTDELRGLEWHTRYEIIFGISKGLLYLHKENDIIHMDLKPANILLDDGMVPKITDFGLSRFDNNSQAATTSRFLSPGYCAPEYISEGKSSLKSDIYSLGVIITELVTGNKGKPDLTKVLRRWRHRWITSSKDTPLGYQQVTKCLELAQRCTQLDPTCRPDILAITHELDEIDTMDGQFPVIPCLLEDILGIEPLEIHIPFELDQQMLHSIELINDTDDHIAFLTKVWLRGLRIEPDKGIVPPRSKGSFTITVQAHINAPPDGQYNKVTVQSTRIDGSLAATDLTGDMFMDEEGKVVDEVNVMVIFGKSPLVEES